MNRGLVGRSGGSGCSGGSFRRQAAPPPSLPAELANKTVQEVTVCINPEWDDAEDGAQLDAAVAQLKAQDPSSIYKPPVEVSTPIAHGFPANNTALAAPVRTFPQTPPPQQQQLQGFGGYGTNQQQQPNGRAAIVGGEKGFRTFAQPDGADQLQPQNSQSVVGQQVSGFQQPARPGQPQQRSGAETSVIASSTASSGSVPQLPITVNTSAVSGQRSPVVVNNGYQQPAPPVVNGYRQLPPVQQTTAMNGFKQQPIVSTMNGYYQPPPVQPIPPVYQPASQTAPAHGSTSILRGNGFGPVTDVVEPAVVHPSTTKKVNKEETVKSYLSSLPPPAATQKPEKHWPTIDNNPVKEFISPPSPDKMLTPGGGRHEVVGLPPQTILNINISSNALNEGGVATDSDVSNPNFTPQIVISSNAPVFHSVSGGQPVGATCQHGPGLNKEDLCSIATVSQKLFEAYAEMNVLFERLSARL